MYIITAKIDSAVHYMGALPGTKKELPYWSQRKDNAVEFHSEQEAQSFRDKNTTLPTEIIPV